MKKSLYTLFIFCTLASTNTQPCSPESNSQTSSSINKKEIIIHEEYKKNFPEFTVITSCPENHTVVLMFFTTHENQKKLQAASIKIIFTNNHLIYLDFLWVHQDFRNNNLGSRLLTTLKKIAASYNFYGISLTATYIDKTKAPKAEKYLSYLKTLNFYKKHQAFYASHKKATHLHRLCLPLIIPIHSGVKPPQQNAPEKITKKRKASICLNPAKKAPLTAHEYHLAYRVKQLFFNA